ncbi:MAG TPA: iron ABC transporter permease [Acidimicrobiia bacterium]|nr:iron ABC transporter permease [Acidimicrobiia bacterium]
MPDSPHRSEAIDDPFGARRRGVVAVLTIALIGAAGANLCVGPVDIEPGAVMRVLARTIGIAIGDPSDAQIRAVVIDIRLPRVLVGVVAGAAAGITGAVLQGLFRNPVADPHLLGIGPGASLGGALGALTGTVPGAIAGGAVGGMLTALLVRRLGRTRATEPSRFVLTGLALGAAISAWVGFVVFVADRTRVPPIDFWLLGNLGASTWDTLGTLTITAGIGVVALLGSARTLDVFALGEADARRLGVDVEMTTLVILLGVGAVIGSAVGAVGVVAFIGLVVPHLIRRLAGATHRVVLLGSAVGGALMMLLADLGARVVVSPQEIPVGLLTAAVGGPFFLWLIRKPGVPT